jgi:hypothetical protein
MPESGVAPEDYDSSKETKDYRNVLEDSDASGYETLENDALIEFKCHRKLIKI